MKLIPGKLYRLLRQEWFLIGSTLETRYYDPGITLLCVEAEVSSHQTFGVKQKTYFLTPEGIVIRRVFVGTNMNRAFSRLCL